MGFLREMVLAYEVGAGAATDAYKAAFQIPDVLNYLLAGGALSIAFVPFYARWLDRDEPRAERMLGVVLGTATALAVAGTVLLWWQTGPLVAWLFGGAGAFAPEVQALTVRLTRIVLPCQVFFIAGGVLRAVLMARGSFASQAAAPVIYNLCIIAGGLLLAPRMGVEGFAWGALVGAVLGPFAVPLWDVRRRGLRVRPRVLPTHPDFLTYAYLAAPLAFGVTLLTVDEWFDRYFGARLAAGTVASLFFARVLLQVPIAMVGQATATAALPAFSRLHAAGEHEALNRLVRRTLQVALGIGVLGAAGLVALAEPVVTVVYERGAFTAGDTDVVAALLRVMGLGVAGWVAQQIAVRAFYAREQMWSPMLLGTAVAVLALPLYAALARRFGAPGLAAAGTLAISANALATLLLARRMHGGPALRPLAAGLLRSAAIAAAAGAAAWAVQRGGAGLPGALLDLVLGGAAFAAVALPAVWLLGDPPLRDAVRTMAARVLSATKQGAAGTE